MKAGNRDLQEKRNIVSVLICLNLSINSSICGYRPVQSDLTLAKLDKRKQNIYVVRLTP